MTDLSTLLSSQEARDAAPTTSANARHALLENGWIYTLNPDERGARFGGMGFRVIWSGDLAAELAEIPRMKAEIDLLMNERAGWLAEIEGLRAGKTAQLRPMSQAPFDGSEILARVIAGGLPYGGFSEGKFGGRWFVLRSPKVPPVNARREWSLYPGFGGCEDDCFDGWLPLPDARPAHKLIKDASA
ncbi:MAG: hypothetical protein ACRC56_11795 [Bosea sp. (in: a-proteobacteria)]